MIKVNTRKYLQRKIMSTAIKAPTEDIIYVGSTVSTRMSYLGRSFEKLHTELCPYSYLGRLPACPGVAVTTDIYSPRLYLFSVSLDCAYARNAFSPRYLNKTKILSTLHSCILSTTLRKVPKVRTQMYTIV